MAITTSSANPKAQARQRGLANRLQDLLREEHAALMEDDSAAIVRLSIAKEQALSDLSSALGGDAASPGLKSIGSHLHDPVLLGTLRAAAAANVVNAQFVGARLAYARARFAGLLHAGYMARAAIDSAGLYKADGFTGGTRPYGAYGRT